MFILFLISLLFTKWKPINIFTSLHFTKLTCNWKEKPQLCQISLKPLRCQNFDAKYTLLQCWDSIRSYFSIFLPTFWVYCTVHDCEDVSGNFLSQESQDEEQIASDNSYLLRGYNILVKGSTRSVSCQKLISFLWPRSLHRYWWWKKLIFIA